MNIQDYLSVLGKNLKKCRSKTGLTQVEIAEIWDVSNDTVSKIENGKNKPSFDLLLEMADYFDESLDYLLERDSKRESELMNKFNKLNKRDQKIVLDLVNSMLLSY